MMYLVDEAGFADVREPADDDGARVRVDGRQTREMLSHLDNKLNQ